MFPNLRLMLSATLATVVLVAIVGSTLVLLRPPPARMADVPEIVRPIMSVADDTRAPLWVDAGARRNEELQRLLALPASPVRAYAPEPAASFPYEVTAAAATDTGDPVVTASVAAPTSADVGAQAPEPAIAVASAGPPPPAPSTPESSTANVAAGDAAVPAKVVAALPELVREPEPAPAAAIPGPAVAAITTAEPSTSVEAAAEPSASSETTAEPVPPGSPNVAAASGGATSPAASVTEVEIFPVSSIPAIDDAPIPRPKPQLALAPAQPAIEKAEPRSKTSMERPHHFKANAKVHRPAVLSRRIRKPLPPPTTFEAQQGQWFGTSAGNGQPGTAGWQSNPEWQSNWNERSDTAAAAERTSGARAQPRAYGIRPPTTAVR